MSYDNVEDYHTSLSKAKVILSKFPNVARKSDGIWEHYTFNKSITKPFPSFTDANEKELRLFLNQIFGEKNHYFSYTNCEEERLSIDIPLIVYHPDKLDRIISYLEERYMYVALTDSLMWTQDLEYDVPEVTGEMLIRIFFTGDDDILEYLVPLEKSAYQRQQEVFITESKKWYSKAKHKGLPFTSYHQEFLKYLTER
jgi:hypothetical protein